MKFKLIILYVASTSSSAILIRNMKKHKKILHGNVYGNNRAKQETRFKLGKGKIVKIISNNGNAITKRLKKLLEIEKYSSEYNDITKC